METRHQTRVETESYICEWFAPNRFWGCFTIDREGIQFITYVDAPGMVAERAAELFEDDLTGLGARVTFPETMANILAEVR